MRQRTGTSRISHTVTPKSELASPSTRRLLDQPHAQREVVAEMQEPGQRRGPIRILRLAQVLDVTGLGKTKIYELQSQGGFPMRVQITEHSVGWVEGEVQAWLAQRIALSETLRPASKSR